MTKTLVVLIAPDRHGKSTALRFAKEHLGKRVRCKEWAAPDESDATPFTRFELEIQALLAGRASYGVWSRSWLDTLFYEHYFTNRQLCQDGYESLLSLVSTALAQDRLKLVFATVGRPVETVDLALRQEQLERNPAISPWFLEQNVRAAKIEAGLFAEHLSSCLQTLPELFPEAGFVYLNNSGDIDGFRQQVLALFS